MNLAFEPTAVIAPEESGLIIGINPTVAHPSSKYVILAREAKRLGALSDGCQHQFDLFSGIGFKGFIGIDLQHPFVSALRRGPVFLAGGVYVLMLNDPRAIFPANRQRSV